MRIPLLSLGIVLASAGVQAAPQARAPEIFPLADVKPGMVFAGTSVFTNKGEDPFEGEVLAVMPDFLAPGESLILCKLRGPAMDRYGVVSGMSGSPVYINGKLVGAVSYRFGNFPREPIAGVTPAAQMLSVLKNRRANPPGWVTAARAPVDSTYGQAVPIETPVLCGGCSRAVLEAIGPRLGKLGMIPVAATSSPSQERFPMFPAGPIAAVLVGGDVSIMGLGTITYMDGDDVLAFGHAFTGAGTVEIPMASAEVFATIPSLSGSAKMGRAGAVVGALSDDRLPAIGGRMGWKARTVPVDLTLEASGPMVVRNQLHFDVVDDIGMGPTLVDVGLIDAILARTGAETIGTVTLAGHITMANGRRIPLDETFSAVPARNPVAAATSMVGDVMEALWRNGFERPVFKGITLTAKHDTEPRIGTITQSNVPRMRVRPGETVRINVDVRTHRAGLKSVAVDVPVPQLAEPGTYDVVVADSDKATEIDRDAGYIPWPDNLDELITVLTENRLRGDRLYVYLLKKSPGARVAGVPVTDLPPSMQAILNDGRDGLAYRKLGKVALHRAVVDPGMVITGSADEEIEVAPPRRM